MFCPTFATPSAKRVPGLAPNHNVSVVPATAALGAPWGLAQIRTSRSSSVAGIGVAFPFVPSDLGTGHVFVPGVQPADHLDVRVRFSIRPCAGVLNPLAEGLVVGAGTIFRERAGLSVHLNRAFALIFKGCHHVAFIMALQHAHGPHPLEEHGLQVFGVRRGRVGFGNRPEGPCAPAVNAPPMVKTIASANLVEIILRRKDMVVLLLRLKLAWTEFPFRLASRVILHRTGSGCAERFAQRLLTGAFVDHRTQ